MRQGYGVWHTTTVQNDDIDVRELGPIATPTRRPLHAESRRRFDEGALRTDRGSDGPVARLSDQEGCQRIDGEGYRRLRKRVLKVKGGWSFHRQAGRSSSSGSAIVKTTSTMYGSSCS